MNQQTVTRYQAEVEALESSLRENIAAAGSRSAAREINAPIKARLAIVDSILGAIDHTDAGFAADAMKSITYRAADNRPISCKADEADRETARAALTEIASL